MSIIYIADRDITTEYSFEQSSILLETKARLERSVSGVNGALFMP